MFRLVSFSLLLMRLEAADVPAGTALVIRLIDGVDSASNMVGQTFRGSMDEAVAAVDGSILIPRGAAVTARLEDVTEAGRFSGRPMLALVLVSVSHEGRAVPVGTYTAVTSGGSRLKRTGTVVGGAAIAGAVAGGIATGGAATAIGLVAGGGAGSAFQILRRGKSLRIPPESRITFRLAYPVAL